MFNSDCKSKFWSVLKRADLVAPKPINLRSQKFENNELIPDVEIVPRGTCCWGNAGKCISAPVKGCEKTDSASIEGNVSTAQNDLGLNEEEQMQTEKADLVSTVESSILPAPPSSHVDVAETFNLLPSAVADNGFVKAEIDSSAGSETSSFPDSVAQSSSSESYSSVSATPISRVDEQKKSSPFSKVDPDDHENPSRFQVEQEVPTGNESVHGAHDFGYFEGFYSTPLTRPGIPYTNPDGMPGSHLESPHRYSFLGVPYYDSAKDKEVVIITMVGSPGVYGNYLPYLGFPDQCSRPDTNGNFPLQFGHFEKCAGPQLSAEMNSAKELGYVCYGQDELNHGWANGSSMGRAQRGSFVDYSTLHSPSEMNLISDECSKRTWRQRASNRNRRAVLRQNPPVVFVPERRVTLLTKDSQHEVVISHVQKKNNYGGFWEFESASSLHCLAEDANDAVPAAQPAQACTQLSRIGPECDKAVVSVETSSDDSAPLESVPSHSTTVQEPLESTGSLVTQGVASVETCSAFGLSEKSLPHELSFFQAALQESGGKHSTTEPMYNKDANLPITCSSSISTSTIPQMLPPNVTSMEKEVLCQSPSASLVTGQVPASTLDTSINFADTSVSKSKSKCLTKVGEIELDCVWDRVTKSAASELACERVDKTETLGVSSPASLPKGNMQNSTKKLAPHKSIKKWQPKGSTAGTQAGCKGFEQQVLGSELGKRGFADNLHINNSRATLDAASKTSLPSSPSVANAQAAGNAVLSPSNCDEFGDVLTAAPLGDTGSDKSYAIKTSEDSISAVCVCKCTVQSHQAVDKFMKTAATAKTQTSHFRIVPPSSGKIWRPKLPGALCQKSSALMMSGSKILEPVNDPPGRGSQSSENVYFKDCTGVLENDMKDAGNAQPRVADSKEDLQDVDHDEVLYRDFLSANVSSNDYERERNPVNNRVRLQCPVKIYKVM